MKSFLQAPLVLLFPQAFPADYASLFPYRILWLQLPLSAMHFHNWVSIQVLALGGQSETNRAWSHHFVAIVHQIKGTVLPQSFGFYKVSLLLAMADMTDCYGLRCRTMENGRKVVHFCALSVHLEYPVHILEPKL